MKRLEVWLICIALLCCLPPGRTDSNVDSGLTKQPVNKTILTPKEGAKPRINGPKIFGVRPGSCFLYTIPATGTRPLKFSAQNLPAGLKLDGVSGQITGCLKNEGSFLVNLEAVNAAGSTQKPFHIVVGNQIALTPPMGWNSWNCWGGAVSQEKVLRTAEVMVDKGLVNHGWTYVNIDDGWQGIRGGPDNAIQPNSKFPDMGALAAKIHQMGLKFGIYSTPWKGSYEGHIGSSCDNEDGTYDWIKSGDHNEYFRIGRDSQSWSAERGRNYWFGKFSFVEKDATQFAQWGVDYLKYDWNPIDVQSTARMNKALRSTTRDIVFSLSNCAPFAKAGDWARLANAWRTTGDISDNWRSVSGIGFNQAQWAPYAGPGHWNDPDMLVVGAVGWGHPHPSGLTANEQYTHFSLWCLLSAPLLIGCNLEALDDFTLGLLTNDDVIDVDQDTLGREATPIVQNEKAAIYAKPLDDGAWAVGLFNRDVVPTELTVKWSDLKLVSPQHVRDLWRQVDLGSFVDRFSVKVAPHGAILIRVTSEK